jgi:hypothetical protein
MDSKLKVLQIRNSDSYVVSESTIKRNLSYNIEAYLNGEVLNNITNKKVVISSNDRLQYRRKNPVITHYQRGDEIMSIEDYNSKPTYYNDDYTDEQVLEAIANKKLLDGFEPVCVEDDLHDFEYEVVGYVEDTKSNFISCTVSYDYIETPKVVFTVFGREIALDEYKKLSIKYKDHAKFEPLDREYLRFVRINNNYVFGDHSPFGDWNYRSFHTNLEDAQKVEEEFRQAVRDAVTKAVFKENLTEIKNLQVLSQLKLIRKQSTKKDVFKLLDCLIEDLQEYVDNI